MRAPVVQNTAEEVEEESPNNKFKHDALSGAAQFHVRLLALSTQSPSHAPGRLADALSVPMSCLLGQWFLDLGLISG